MTKFSFTLITLWLVLYFGALSVRVAAEEPPTINPPQEEPVVLPAPEPVEMPQASTAPEGSVQARGYVINFDNVGIVEYLRWISDITHTNFIFNEQELQFNITIISKEPASVNVIMASLLQILHIHDLALMEQGNNILIYKSADKDKSGPSSSNVISEHYKSEDSAIATKVFRLVNVQPGRIARIIQPMLSKNAQVEVSAETRHLIVTDLAINIDKVENLLKTLDQPNSSLDIGIFNVHNMNINSLILLAERIVSPLSEENPLILVPQPSTNTVFIISTPYLIEKTISILETLDVETRRQGFITTDGRQNTGNITQDYKDLPLDHIEKTVFKVYKLKYHQGNEIQDSLRKIGNTLANTGIANAGLTSTIQTIEWVDSSNSLVFSGSPEAIAKLEELIETLDTPRKEVFIEMLVIDTSIGKSLQIGVDTAADIRGRSSASAGGFGSGASGTAPLVTALQTLQPGSTPDATNLISGSSFSFGVIGEALHIGSNTYMNLGGVVNALQADVDTSIIMNPQIVTESGHAAELFVGSTDRFLSSQISGTQGTTISKNYEYRNIGTRFRVTPTIGNSNIVTLDIDQEITTGLGDNGSSGSSNNLTNDSSPLVRVYDTKQTRTRVHVPDRYFLVLSGMISEERQHSKSQVPCLGSIPVIGGFAGKKVDNKNTKRNIVIFIRPHIITTTAELEEVTKIQQKVHQQEYDKTPSNVNFQVNSLLEWLDLKEQK